MNTLRAQALNLIAELGCELPSFEWTKTEIFVLLFFARVSPMRVAIQGIHGDDWVAPPHPDNKFAFQTFAQWCYASNDTATDVMWRPVPKASDMPTGTIVWTWTSDGQAWMRFWTPQTRIKTLPILDQNTKNSHIFGLRMNATKVLAHNLIVDMGYELSSFVWFKTDAFLLLLLARVSPEHIVIQGRHGENWAVPPDPIDESAFEIFAQWCFASDNTAIEVSWRLVPTSHNMPVGTIIWSWTNDGQAWMRFWTHQSNTSMQTRTPQSQLSWQIRTFQDN
jgi:hypothetical protein